MIQTIQVGTGNQRKVVQPVLLTGLNDSGEITPIQISDTGALVATATTTPGVITQAERDALFEP